MPNMKAFTDHPNSVGESYFEHMRSSLGFGTQMLIASLGCFVHALFPFLCVKTGSSTIKKLHRKMVTHRSKLNDHNDSIDTVHAS